MRLFQTGNEWAGLILRISIGIVMLPHGAQKLLGWFGGPGFSATIQIFSDKLQIHPVLTFLVILSESFGSLGLIIGLLTRVSAFGTLCVMTGAVVLVHWPHGFFMNWYGNQAGEGFEFHLLAIGMSLALLIMGGGRWSADGRISRTLGYSRRRTMGLLGV
ncbi:MAG: DoxX family protein [Syntrophobacteraceae bacterium]|nr:DoxX family protein [Syntrophobacteraceae bacterium]NTW37722.1 DoxX family protein [Syntrophobacteraceae bacterium]